MKVRARNEAIEAMMDVGRKKRKAMNAPPMNRLKSETKSVYLVVGQNTRFSCRSSPSVTNSAER